MKKILFIISLIFILSMFLISCTPGIDVSFVAEAVNGTAGVSLKSIDMGNNIIVDAYNVTFYKIEVGNSEDDKFTLWENSDGVEMNLVDAVAFSDLNTAVAGTYKFCRITIHEELSLEGENNGTSGTATFAVTGNFSSDGTTEVFLFGTSDAIGSPSGDFLLTDEIEVSDGSILTFTVNIAGTVTDAGGGAINLSEPSITFTD